MPPTDWTQLLIWLAMQFPVLAACAAIVWWLLRWTGKKQAEEMQRVDKQNSQLLTEKEVRI